MDTVAACESVAVLTIIEVLVANHFLSTCRHKIPLCGIPRNTEDDRRRSSQRRGTLRSVACHNHHTSAPHGTAHNKVCRTRHTIQLDDTLRRRLCGTCHMALSCDNRGALREKRGFSLRLYCVPICPYLSLSSRLTPNSVLETAARLSAAVT